MKRTSKARVSSFAARLGLIWIYIAIALFTVYVVLQYFVFDPTTTPGSFVQRKLEKIDFHYRPWISLLLIHIIGGTLALVLGPFQFSTKLRNKYKNLHRTIGKIYMISILIAGLIGCYLSIGASGGLAGTIGFLSLDVAWLVPTIMGYITIRKGDVRRHQEWMLRSYAVTLTFITFRLWSIPVVGISGTYGLLFGLTIWYSWLFNLAIAQLIIRSKRRRLPDREVIHHDSISHVRHLSGS